MSTVRAAKMKLAVAIVFDAADFVGGWIPGFGTAFDALLTVVAVVLFGWKGLFQLWEVAAFPPGMDLVDGFIPTLTLLAIAELREAKKQEAALAAEQVEQS
ncbi:MAG: hypothetical protein HRU11_00535 [Parvularculaceae bacterium]|nr:hypothetical protein [Parvularculaceae bacterium]